MVFRVQAIVFLAMVLVVLVEARWFHGLSTARKLRALHQDYLLRDELAALLRLGDVLADDSGGGDGQDDDLYDVDEYPEALEPDNRYQLSSGDSDDDPDNEEGARPEPRRHPKATRRRGQHRKLRHPRAGRHPASHMTSKEQSLLLDLVESPTTTRGKRHNRLKSWTELDRRSYINSRPKPSQFDNERMFEVEVREAQNSSLCNYTVVPIPDPSGTRLPRELEHIKCNHVGSKCQDRGTYCCLQTYRNVEVVYGDSREPKTEMLKVYSGCVCSLQIYGTLEPYTPRINIDD